MTPEEVKEFLRRYPEKPHEGNFPVGLANAVAVTIGAGFIVYIIYKALT